MWPDDAYAEMRETALKLRRMLVEVLPCADFYCMCDAHQLLRETQNLEWL